MTPRLTSEDRQFILRRFQEGVPLRQISREAGRPDITIRRVLESLGVSLGAPRTSNLRSSPEVEAHVVHLYDQGLSWREITDQAGVTSVTVSKILRRNGREFDRKPEGTDGKTDLITALYESGHSTRAIGQMLGHSKSTINTVVAGNGGKIRTVQGCENPDFFDQVDTPAKAYWLGFISADGCIVATPRNPEGNHLAMQLAIRDKSHLTKLKEALGANAGVRTRVNTGFGKTLGSALLSVGSRRLTDGLLALGVTPRKSATQVPWDGPAHLMPHYWRGMMDGDGSLARKGDGLFTIFLCGSEPCVRGFAKWAAQVCGTTAKPYTRSGCWYVGISGRYKVPRLVSALYKDAPVSLDRKQEIANRILDAAENAC
jgi:hypothetical protein